MKRPTNIPTDYYYHKYIEQVWEDSALEALENSFNETISTFENLNETKGNHRYQEGKWTIKQLLQHIIDTERVFIYRALRLSRKDATPLPGFSEDDFAENDNTTHLTLSEIIEDYSLVRKGSISFFQKIDSSVLDFEGKASKLIFTPRIVCWITAGHNIHHLKVLKERYLNA